MAKRKLSRHQRERIRQQQHRELAQARAEDTPGEDEATTTGLVLAHLGREVEVETGDGELYRCHFRTNLEQLVAGDRVVWRPVPADDNGRRGVITALESRETVLRRPDPYGHLKPVAANLDRVLVTFAPLPAPSTVLLDRYLVAAELSGITPVLLLNKADLLDTESRAWLERTRVIYRQAGYELLEASAVTGDGMDLLRDALGGHTSVLVGQSGVGKSSLVNALLPELALDTADVSRGSGLGRHTTTTARLFHLPDGGRLIDSPGIREFGLWHITPDELLRGYRELYPLSAECRFRNCSHRQEPGCALWQAAEDGRVSPERLENFFHIADTLDETSRHKYRR